MKVLFTWILAFKGLTDTLNTRNYEIIAFVLSKLVILTGYSENVKKGKNVAVS
jgi:hypothetical protein